MRPGRLWPLLVVVAGVAVFGTALLTVRLLELEASRNESRRQAALEENVRLALWRMDSRLAPFLSQAASTLGEPGEEDPAGRAARALAAVADSDWILGILETTRGSGPVVLAERAPERAGPEARGSAASLADVVPPADVQPILASLQKLVVEPDAVESGDVAAADAAARPDARQLAQNTKEYMARLQIVQQGNRLNVDPFLDASEVAAVDERRRGPSPLGSPATPVWRRGRLMIVQGWNWNGGTVRAVVLDWPKIQNDLAKLVGDILPSAELRPVEAPAAADKARMLASLPILLAPGAVEGPVENSSALRSVLLLAWAALALAVLATAALVRGLVALSERRAAFVSSVTHELRTPLTTLRMYAEMLADEIVQDPGKRREYLATLRTEADRLASLVENVLAYARLERRAAPPEGSRLSLASIRDAFGGRIEQRARDAGFEIRVADCDDDAVDVLAHPEALEQILFNLVDNGCKYAAGAADRSIDVSCVASARTASILVADHGPGIAAGARKGLFRPFRRAPRPESPSTPGVGLGLALSRQLARQMSGDLRLKSTGADGTCFELVLKRLPPVNRPAPGGPVSPPPCEARRRPGPVPAE